MKNYRWTVFFLMKIESDSLREATTLLEDLLELELGGDTMIILCMKGGRNDIRSAIDGRSVNDDGKTPSGMTTTVFYKILSRQDTMGKWSSSLEKLYEQKDFDITKPHHITYYFKRFVLSNHLADRYMLFTWDHGDAYSIFNEADKKLTMDQLGQAIDWGFEGKKIDLLVMMDCSMLTMDTLFALHSRVKYLVAPEISLSADGYNYPSIFKRLVRGPGISAGKLARTVVSSIGKKFYENAASGVAWKSAAGVFVCDMHFGKLFFKVCARIFDVFQHADEELKGRMYTALASAYPVVQGDNLIDFFSFLRVLKTPLDRTGGVEGELRLLIEIFIEIRDQLVPWEFIGETAKGKAPRKDLIPEGFSIYFPLDKSLPELGGSNYFLNTEFAASFGLKTLIGKFGPSFRPRQTLSPVPLTPTV